MNVPLRNDDLARAGFFKIKTAQRSGAAGEKSFTDRQRQIDFIYLPLPSRSRGLKDLPGPAWRCQPAPFRETRSFCNSAGKWPASG